MTRIFSLDNIVRIFYRLCYFGGVVVFSMKKRGRFFTSRYILLTYSPIIPNAINRSDPINHSESINDAQPGYELPNNIAIATYIVTERVITRNISPTVNIMRIGRIEKDVIPSIAKLSIFKNGYFVFPPFRGLRS